MYFCTHTTKNSIKKMEQKPKQLRKVCLLLTLIITMCQQVLFSATGISHFYDTDQLSSNLITCICQDKQGYIWVSTEYGLNRFDGVHFTHYYTDDNSPQPLLNNICRKVICDREGRVWVIFHNGIQYYDRLHNSFPIVELQCDEQSYPTDILEMNDGRLLVLTIRKGLFLIDTDRMEAHQWEEANKLYVDSEASCMYEDSRGRIWICSDKTGLTMIDVKSKQTQHFGFDELGSNGVNAVSEDGRGRVVVLSRKMVLLYDETSKSLRMIGNSEHLYRRTLFKTGEGKVLMATYGNGMFEVDVDGNQLIPVLHETVDGVTIGTQSIQAYLEDAQHNKWIGCLRAGMACLTSRQQPFTYYNLQELPNDNGSALSLLTYQNGRFILGQENNGLTDISTDSRILGHRFPGEYIIAYQETGAGDIWLGTYGRGASIVKGGKSVPAVIDSLYGKRIKDFAVDGKGTIYLAVFDNGLLAYRADGSPFVPKGGKFLLNNRYPNKLFIDSKGWLWIGHYNGVDVYDTQSEQMVDVPVDSILRPTHTFAITESRDGLIWVGTNKGLFCYDRQKKAWQQLGKDDGLCNEIVCGIVEDEKGDLWISTYRGLSHLLRKEGRFINYYKGNGLESSCYTRGIYGKSPDGQVYFGNNRGITYFYPAKVGNIGFEHGISLTGLFVAGREIGTDGEHIRLSHEDNTFTLRFSTMDYREASNIQYEYRFADEGRDVWHQLPPGVSEMILSHLRFGNHKLQVRAQENGVYSETKEISIRITPPWYRSWWVYILYALLVTILVMMIILNVRNKQLADLNEEKIRFFVDISHELRSPLTLIKSPLDKLLQITHDPTETKALRSMRRNADRMLTLVNQILSIRKIEKGQMKMHFAETDLNEFVGDICHDFDYQAESRKINLVFEQCDTPLMVWIDRDYFDKVVTNLISNALKYVSDEGDVTVRLREADGKYAELVVRDNGSGIDEKLLKKIFDRFYQTSARPAAGQMGYGIGLNLTQKLTALHKGTITARNRTDGKGSEFIVQLQLGKSHLPQTQIVDEDYFARKDIQKSPVLTKEADHTIRKKRKKTNYKIAVVDDDPEICTFLETELGDTYYISTYPDGKAAIAGVTDDVPDLIISDVVMPQMDGITFMHRVKNNSKLSHVPVILLTSKTDYPSLLKGLEEGADAYIEKPFNLEELEVRIASLIANRLRVKGKYSGVQEQEDNLRQIEIKGINEELMQRIMTVINARLEDNDFNVEALADEVCISRSQLHRRIKEITGISVGEFIRNFRLQQAAKLLEKGDTNISQITYATGFSSPTHFSTAFKKYYGVSPSEYMNRHSGETKS